MKLENNKTIPFKGFTIRVISEEKTMRERQDVVDMLNRLVVESEEDMIKSGQNLKSQVAPDKAWQVDDSWLSTFESTHKHALVLEKNGKPLAMTVFMINDPETRQNLGVKGDFAIFIKALTEKRVRNTGILGVLTKIAQSLIEERGLDPTYIGCVTAKTVVDDGVESYHVMNLERYAIMYDKMFHKNQLQIRYKDKEGNQVGRDLFDMNRFFKDGKIDHKAIDSLIREHQPIAAKEDKEVLGFYLVGDCPKRWANRVADRQEIRSRL